MNVFFLSCACILLAYLIGAIPFGYLIARRAGGIDIRTVGSGNIGATNVGRVLGFRFFVLVFALDLLKGFLPTSGFPRLVESTAGERVPALAVLVALASILGHNFPVYLRFRGGKGVATSLGAVLALDATAALGAAAGFGASLLTTRYVSVSSLFAGVVFAAVHFARTPAPFGRDQIAMTVLTVVLLILLVFRHRKNLARLRAGTEPRVPLGRRKKPPEGRIAWVLLATIAVLGAAAALLIQASRRPVLNLGPCTLAEVARVATGYQRAERVAFADRGRLLAVTCPRYNRVVLYRVTSDERLILDRDLALQGRPVALWPVGDRLHVLERPPGDARHVEPGFWETFDFSGRKIGAPHRVGFYPDDLAITPDGRHALVLTSGRAEGGTNRPLPALTVFEIGPDQAAHRVVGRLELDRPDDDPERLLLDARGNSATIALLDQNRETRLLTVDLSDPARPRPTGAARPLAAEDPPLVLPGGGSVAWSPQDGGEAVLLELPGFGRCVACTWTKRSILDLWTITPRQAPLGQLFLRGAWNLSPVRPTGIASAPERGLIAAATRSGGVHLIAVRPRGDRRVAASTPEPGSEPEPGVRRR